MSKRRRADSEEEDVKTHTKSSSSRSDATEMGPGVDDNSEEVLFSVRDRGGSTSLSSDRKQACGQRGYRLMRATHGVSVGTWYFEFVLIGATRARASETTEHESVADPGAYWRLGWASAEADNHGPVGMDEFGYGFRCHTGSLVHRSIRTHLGDSCGSGDVVGCMIHLPPGFSTETAVQSTTGPQSSVTGAKEAWMYVHTPFGAGTTGPPPAFPAWRQVAIDSTESNLEKAKKPKEEEKEDEKPEQISSSAKEQQHSSAPLTPIGTKRGRPIELEEDLDEVVNASWIRFFVNGKPCGGPIQGLRRVQRYFPAASMYGSATTRLNTGPNFDFPPATPNVDGQKWLPLCLLPNFSRE